MTEEQWEEIGRVLRKVNDEKPPTEFQQSFIDASDHQGYPRFSSSSQSGNGKPHESSWLTTKLLGWLHKYAD